MKFRIHRGAREVGGNCIELNAAGKSLLLDLGMPLSPPDSDNPSLPDVPGLGEVKPNPNFLGVVLSHPHADHYGLLTLAARSTKVYLGDDALRILDASSPFTSLKLSLSKATTYQDRRAFSVGPFRITPFLVDHSAFDAYMLLVECEGHRFLYSGDFRGHGRKRRAFERLLKEPAIKGVDVLLMEGTNLGRDADKPSKTEEELEEAIAESIRATPGIVLACFSAQNMDRFVTFWKATRRCKRMFVADAYLASVIDALARPTLPKPKVFLPSAMKRKLKRERNAHLVRRFSGRRIFVESIAERASELVMLFRPSMREDIEQIQALRGGRLIYSQWSGYIDRDRFNLRDWCKRNGVTLETLHTSGHADVPTLLRFAKAVDAKRVIPIHSATPDRLSEFHPNAAATIDRQWLDLGQRAPIREE